jgi:hypothetical protein
MRRKCDTFEDSVAVGTSFALWDRPSCTAMDRSEDGWNLTEATLSIAEAPTERASEPDGHQPVTNSVRVPGPGLLLLPRSKPKPSVSIWLIRGRRPE